MWIRIMWIVSVLIAAPQAGHAADLPEYHLEPVIVTATRIEVSRAQVPVAVTVIERRAIEQTNGLMVTDILSRNTSVDVTKYPGVLSGIGLRGFPPEVSGTTKHTLLLVDGRPGGATNLSALFKYDIERIEVLKGPASSLYGSEAMGGVINIITRRSAGRPHTTLSLTGGSFEYGQIVISSGGRWTDRVDYDVNVHGLSQGDFKTGSKGQGGAYGSGTNRPFTGRKERGLALRLGAPFSGDRLRVDLRGDLYEARDVQSPGALPEKETNQATKEVDRQSLDLAFRGRWGANRWLARVYRTGEGSNFQTRSTRTGRYVTTFEDVIEQVGGQLQDTLAYDSPWGLFETTSGLDLSTLKQSSKVWSVAQYNPGLADGTPQAPYSPDYAKETVGLFAEERLELLNKRLIVTAGARLDRYALETLPTPLKTDFTPGKATRDVVNPRGGIVLRLLPPLRFHGTIGRAFVTPTAIQVAGFSETVYSGVTRGNPDLKPESSVTWDTGVTWEKHPFRMDATYFNTRISDKIEAVSLGSVQGKPTTSYTNVSKAEMHGLETELDLEMGPLLHWESSFAFFARHTWIIKKEAESSAGQRDSTFHGVADQKITYGLTYDDGQHLSGRFSARYVSEASYFDFYSTTFPSPLTTREPFHVVDLSLQYRASPIWSFALRVDNVLDTYYEETKEFPMPGRAVFLTTEITL